MAVSEKRAKPIAVPIALPLVSSSFSPERITTINKKAAPQSTAIREPAISLDVSFSRATTRLYRPPESRL